MRTAAVGTSVVPQTVSACALQQLGPSGALKILERNVKQRLEDIF